MTIEKKTTQFDADVENAIKARGLHEAMMAWDAESRSKRPVMHWIYGFSAAAAVALLVLFFAPFRWPSTQVVRAQVEVEDWSVYDAIRGGDVVTDCLGKGSALMLAADYTAAHKAFSKAEKEALTSQNLSAQEAEEMDDVRWYEVLADLSRGQLFYTLRAKRMLRVIASEEGIHQKEAQNLLNRL